MLLSFNDLGGVDAEVLGQFGQRLVAFDGCHALNSIDVILEIGVNADDGIAIGGEQASDQGILMSSVSREFDAGDLRVRGGQLLD